MKRRRCAAPRRISLATALCAALLGGLPARARACSACDSGDPTLTVAGSEPPFAGRLRSAAELRYRTDEIGSRAIDGVRIRELRGDLSLAWAADAQLFLLADVPWLYRRLEWPSLARQETFSLGELELGAKWLLWRDRAFAPRWLFALSAGAKLPTAPELEDALGRALPTEAQPGSGSLDAALGPSLAWFQGAFSAYASVSVRQVLWARAALEPGRSASASVALQAQLLAAAALRGVTELRWDQASREHGQRDPNSGGSIAFCGADLLLSPLLDLSIVAGLRVPVLNRLHGAHTEGASLRLALVRDW